MHSEAAEGLLLGTALKESQLIWLRQHAGGPALGVYQIEIPTALDVRGQYLERRADIEERVAALETRQPMARQLITNLAFATAIARLIYWRRPESLPDYEDADGMGAYWKAHYNTHLGAGHAADFAELYRTHVL